MFDERDAMLSFKLISNQSAIIVESRAVCIVARVVSVENALRIHSNVFSYDSELVASVASRCDSASLLTLSLCIAAETSLLASSSELTSAIEKIPCVVYYSSAKEIRR